jgi:nicotinamide riboside kinase
MRIAVVGSHGTGKTSVAKGMAEKLGFNFIRDVARDAFKMGFPINENTPCETQFWILSKQLELERTTPESWVMDKSLYDNIVYGEFVLKDQEALGVIRRIIEKNARYDLIIYVPIEFSIPDDGIRSVDENFQKTIDAKLIEYFRTHKISYVTVKGSISTRINKALEAIEKIRKKNG